MLVPKHVREELARTATLDSGMEKTIQGGCTDGCGWAGDPWLILRQLPTAGKFSGRGWAVLHHRVGEPAIVLYRSDREQPLDPYAVDHRVITWLQEAGAMWQKNKDGKMIDMLVAHDDKVEQDKRKYQAELAVETSKFVGSELRRAGVTTKKHKIDKKKDH